MIYEPFSVVIVPFPFTDSMKTKKRPALIINSEEHQKNNEVVTLLMITSSQHQSWFGDHAIKDLSVTGLPVTSIIRQKIFSIDKRLVIRKIGLLSFQDQKNVLVEIKRHLAVKNLLN